MAVVGPEAARSRWRALLGDAAGGRACGAAGARQSATRDGRRRRRSSRASTDTGEPGFDLFVERAQAGCAEGRAVGGRRAGARRGDRRGAAHRGRRAAVSSRHGRGDDSARGGHRVARDQLHEGLLRRPGSHHPRAAPRPRPRRAQARRPELDGDAVPAAGARRSAAATARSARSRAARVSPALQRPIALGYVHRDFVEPGTTVTVGERRRRDGRGAAVRAVVASAFRRTSSAKAGRYGLSLPASAARISSASAGGNSQRRELSARDPPHLLTELRHAARRAARSGRNAARRARSGYAWVVVRISSPIARVDVELLAQLAREARRERFAGVALAAGKLPVALEVRALPPSRDEEPAVALDDRGGDDDAWSCVGRERIRAAALRHRADEALRLARDADHRAEIHQRLVEVEHVPDRARALRRRAHRCRFIAWLFGSPVADEHPEQHARDVGVEDRGALAEREAADRAGGVGADALERQQRLLVGRQLAAVPARPPRARSSAAACGRML